MATSTPRPGETQPLTPSLTIVPPAGGRRVERLFGEETVIKADQSLTGDAYALRENAVPAGFGGVPFHIHHLAEEAFYILAGEMTLFTPDATHEAGPGSFVLIPRGMAHSFANRGSVPLRWLTLFSPAWVSGWIEEESDLLRASAPAAPDPAQQRAIYEQYGLEIVAPPPAQPDPERP